MWQKKSELDALNVDLACLVKENLPEQIDEFHKSYWPGPIYLDENMSFFKALGSKGKVRKGNLASLAMSLLNPWSDVWKVNNAAKSHKVEGNFVGEGTILGGVFVMGRGNQGVVYQFREEDFGVHAPLDDVISAAKKASTA